MSIDQIYRIVQYCVSKSTTDGYVSPEDFNNAINFGQRSYLDYLLGEYQRYQVKRPIAVVEFGQNERIRQSISPLIYGTVLAVDATGLSPFPSDHEYPDAMWSLYGLYNIRFVQQDRLSSWYRSSIDPIDSNPVYLIKHEGFQFYPENIEFARLSYVRTPPTIRWSYILNANDEPVYDPLNSIDPVWAEGDILQIIVRTLQFIGINLQFPLVLQYANEVKQGGQ